MATIYIAPSSASPAGNDANVGSLASPKRTFNGAKGSLSAGDTLIARGGTYTENISSWPSGTSSVNKIRVTNYPGETVTIVGGTSTVWGFSFTTDEHYIDFDGINIDGSIALENTIVLGPINALQAAQPHHVRLMNGTIYPNQDNTATSTWGAHGIEVVCKVATGTGGHEFINLTISSPGRPGTTNYDNGYGIYVETPNCIIDGCDLVNCKGAGVHVYNDDGDQPHNTIIKNCRVRAQSRYSIAGQSWGIVVTTNSNQVFNNFIYDITAPDSDSGSAGITVGGSGSGNIICNNTIYNVYSSGITLKGPTTSTEVRNNIIYLQGGTALNYVGGSTYTSDHNLTGTNPGFVNTATGDFRVTSSSAAYHAGVHISSITITVDFYGVTYNNPPTIGAAEVNITTGSTITIGDNSTDTFSGTTDAQLQQEFPTTNYGTDVQLGISKYSAGFWIDSVIKFDLSPLTGKTITDVTLGLFYEFGSAGNNTLSIYRLLRDWTEGGVNWNTYNSTNAWTTAGGTAATDRSTTSSGSVILQGTTYGYYEINSAQLLLDVQNMVSGAVSNYGWMQDRSDASNDFTYKTITSSEGADTQRPYLRVTYTDASTTVIYMVHYRARRN